MAKFLNTSATTYYLEEMIKNTHERLFLISPFLKFNERMKQLLLDQSRLNIEIHIVYGKEELKPSEMEWLKSLAHIHLYFCQNLHAKCYMNEESCIITSLNLYEFSQVNNHEMGILITRNDDKQVYQDSYDEAQRIIRISQIVYTPKAQIANVEVQIKSESTPQQPEKAKEYLQELTTAKLAKKLGLTTEELNKRLCEFGFQELKGNKYYLTEQGKYVGGTLRHGKFGYFIVWPDELSV